MYSNVRQLRRNGMRFKRDGEAGAGVNGAVSLVHFNGYPCLQVHEWGNPNPDGKLLPPLVSAVCKNFQGNVMRFEGFQREHENAPAYFQEWLITIISDRPPAEAAASARPAYAHYGAGK